jgi:hypothetical protein
VDPLQSLIYLQSDFEKIAEDRERFGWKFDPCPPSSTTFRFGLIAVDAELFWFLCGWDGYPGMPPSLLCVDPQTGSTSVRSSWPNCDGSRPGDGFCWEFTREAQTRLHPEWGQNPAMRWTASGNSLQTVLEEIYFNILRNSQRYHGRMK